MNSGPIFNGFFSTSLRIINAYDFRLTLARLSAIFILQDTISYVLPYYLMT